MMRKLSSLIVVGALALLAGSCGGEGGVEVDGAWARSSPAMADAGAVYMDITSPDGDRLVRASVDAAIAGTVEVHETVMASLGDEEEGASDEEGMGAMAMQEVGDIALPAGETVSLEPGGFHIMLLQLGSPLEVGDTFEVTLQFETADDEIVEVEVREEAP